VSFPNQNLQPQEQQPIGSVSDLLKPTLKSISVDELNDLLASITEAYDRAQARAKEYETTFGEVPIACINQMRNAGYHMCRFIKDSQLTNGTPLINTDELRSTYKHLLRAYYDALDEFTKKISEMLNEIESNYKTLLLNPVDLFSNFYSWKDKLSQLESFRVEDQNTVLEIAITKTKREQHYERIAAHLDELIYIHSQIRHMTDRLVVEGQRIAKEENEKNLAEQRAIKAEKRADAAEVRAIKSFRWAIVGVIVSICIFLFGNNVTSNKEASSPKLPTSNSQKP
jgi:hypothetical protein